MLHVGNNRTRVLIKYVFISDFIMFVHSTYTYVVYLRKGTDSWHV